MGCYRRENLGKRRPAAHTIGEQAVNILKNSIPQSWVLREYSPDYGIDCDIEFFAELEDGSQVTKGEHILAQIKGVKGIQIQRIRVWPRLNVELGSHEFRGRSDFTASEMEVIPFLLETPLLSLVEKMGSAVPVLLIVVDVTTKRSYFVCLNDYIEKILVPKVPNFEEQGTVTIHVPLRNEIGTELGLAAVEGYGKRAKLYAFCNKVNYQHCRLMDLPECEFDSRVKYFLERIIRLDVWNEMILADVRKEVEAYLSTGYTSYERTGIEDCAINGKGPDAKQWESDVVEGRASLREIYHKQGLLLLWDKMVGVSQMLEDMVKEGYLPTDMANQLCYSDVGP